MPVISMAFRTTSTRAASAMLGLSQSLQEDAAAASCCTSLEGCQAREPPRIPHRTQNDLVKYGLDLTTGEGRGVCYRLLSHVFSTDQLEAFSQQVYSSPRSGALFARADSRPHGLESHAMRLCLRWHH